MFMSCQIYCAHELSAGKTINVSRLLVAITAMTQGLLKDSVISPLILNSHNHTHVLAWLEWVRQPSMAGICSTGPPPLEGVSLQARRAVVSERRGGEVLLRTKQ